MALNLITLNLEDTPASLMTFAHAHVNSIKMPDHILVTHPKSAILLSGGTRLRYSTSIITF